MNAIEQLEALNPVPDYRGNPGRPAQKQQRSKSRAGAVLVAAAVLLVAAIAGSFVLRGNDPTNVDLEVAAQPDLDQESQPQEAPSALGPPSAPTDLDGTAMARLIVPEINVDQIVVEGVGIEALRKGPGHYPDTPLPGQAGNAAIAGHRTTYGAPFHRLDELDPDDAIFVTTAQGTFEYRIVETTIVTPDETQVLNDFGDDRLTLTAGHPKYSNRERIVVVAELVGLPVETIALEDLPTIVVDGPSVQQAGPSGLVPVQERNGDRMLGRLTIPEIDLDTRLLAAVAGSVMRPGPEHILDTPLPGQAGNAAIFAHRTRLGAHFERLNELEPGDRIFVTTLQGDFEYQVAETVIVEPDNTQVLDDFGDNRLTLVSEHPKDSAQQRIVVIAHLLVDTVPTVDFDSLPLVAETAQSVRSDAPDIRWDNYQDDEPPYASFHGNADALQSAQGFLMQFEWGDDVSLEVHEQILGSASIRWVHARNQAAGWIVLSFRDGRYWVEDMTTDGIDVYMDGVVGGGGRGFVQSDEPIQVEIDYPLPIWLHPDLPVRADGRTAFNTDPLLLMQVRPDEVDQRIEFEVGGTIGELNEVRFIFRNGRGEQIGAAISTLAHPAGRPPELFTHTDKVDALHRYLAEHPQFVDEWLTVDEWQSVEWLLQSMPGRAPKAVEEVPRYQATWISLDLSNSGTLSEAELDFMLRLFEDFQVVSGVPPLPEASAVVDLSSSADGYVVDELPATSQCLYQGGQLSITTTYQAPSVFATPEEAVRSAPQTFSDPLIEFTNSDGTVLGYAQAFDGRPWTFRQVITVEEVDGGWVVDRWETTGC